MSKQIQLQIYKTDIKIEINLHDSHSAEMVSYHGDVISVQMCTFKYKYQPKLAQLTGEAFCPYILHIDDMFTVARSSRPLNMILQID